MTPKTRGVLRRFGEFCHREGIDPALWIDAKHDVIGWKRRVPVRKLLNYSPEFLAKFKAWGQNRAAEDRGQARLSAHAEDDTDGAAALTSTAEAVKRVYAMTPEVCLLSAETLTLGWHPASPWCESCRLQESCRDALPAETQALRDAHARC
tara:strand:+ start:3623 stop:4075 length:453 start_codon:yes stop_codon:yes gene_type:complete